MIEICQTKEVFRVSELIGPAEGGFPYLRKNKGKLNPYLSTSLFSLSLIPYPYISNYSLPDMVLWETNYIAKRKIEKKKKGKENEKEKTEKTEASGLPLCHRGEEKRRESNREETSYLPQCKQYARKKKKKKKTVKRI